MTRASALAVAVLTLAACAAPARKQRGAQCELNSECDTPLVCRLGACRKECATTRDCAAGTQCLLDDAGLGACQLDTELHCARPSDCTPPLTCASGACVDPCREDRDCPPGAGCVAGDAGVRGCVDVSSHACVRDSECAGVDAGVATRLVCAHDGRCRIECASDRECRFGTRCIAGSCGVAAPTPDGGVGDAGAGGGDGGATTDSGAADGAAGDAATDAGATDSGATDAGATDAGATDSGASDSGATDAGATDAGTDAGVDAGTDAGTDAGPDAGFDAGLPCATGPSTATQVVVGQQFACALVSGGNVWCWGSNSDGQLGPGGPAGYTATAVQVTGITGATFLAAGQRHVCALVAGGGVRCWGRNVEGQLGNGSTVSSATPVPPVGGLASIRMVAASVWNTCVVDTSNVVDCWGRWSNGSMGNGMPGDVGVMSSPIPLSLLPPVAGTEVAVTTLGGCVLQGGGVLCWGQNDHGQMGSAGGPVLVPTAVPGVSGTHIRASTTHVCVEGPTPGMMACWGANGSGELGDGTTAFSRPTPMAVTGLGGTTRGAVGADFTCAAVGTGVKCWGSNAAGQLGDGTMTDRALPVDVVGLPGTTIAWIDAGTSSACVATSTGAVYCWGANDLGQLGPGGPVSLSTSPVQVTCLP